MEYQTTPNVILGPPCVSYQSMSHNEGIALLLESEWLPQPAFGFLLTSTSPHPPPVHQPPIESIHDITGAEKNYLKNQQHSNSLWN